MVNTQQYCYGNKHDECRIYDIAQIIQFFTHDFCSPTPIHVRYVLCTRYMYAHFSTTNVRLHRKYHSHMRECGYKHFMFIEDLKHDEYVILFHISLLRLLSSKINLKAAEGNAGYQR